MKKIKLTLLALSVLLIVVCLSGCTSSKTADGIEYEIENGTATIVGYTDTTTRTEIIIPDEFEGVPVTEIADFGLFNAESVEKIVIGKNVQKIGGWSMTNEQKLKAFEVDSENQHFTSVDGVLFSKDMKTLIYYPPAKGIEFNNLGQAKEMTQYVIPNGVETIRTKAFYKCYYVDKIEIPDSVTTIEEKAFHRCSALKEINLPDTLVTIGKDAFAYCSEVTSVIIPSSVESIGEYAFFNCPKLKKVEVLKSEDEIELGKKWYPTDNGREIKDLQIIWK